MLTVDLGNSSLSIGRWLGDDVSLRHFEDPDAAAREIDGPVWIVSVAARRLEALLSALPDPLRESVTILDGIPLALASPTLAKSTGRDRFAAALAASPGPAVIIDAGTALTVDLLDHAGVFLGGFIAPGPQAALDGLARAGSALTSLAADCCELKPGLDTPSAMRAGAWGLVVGGADRLVRVASKMVPGARLIATGGWAAAWLSASELDSVMLDEHLVHKGIVRWAAQAGAGGAAGSGDGASRGSTPS